MKRSPKFSVCSWLKRRLAGLVLLLLCCREGLAADEFQELIDRIPRSANAVVILNMEKAMNSPFGVKEGWKSKMETAFQSGLARVPPQAIRFVLASQMNYETLEPFWEAAVVDLGEDMSMRQIAQLRGGTSDTIESLAAIQRPNNTCLVQLGPARIAAMGPANRQAMVRWMRDVRKMPPPPLSPYLQKAAVYSDEAGSEIIMALDLDGEISFERAGKYLKAQEKMLQERLAEEKNDSQLDLIQAAKILCSIDGVRLGVRLNEQPSGKVVVDAKANVAKLAPFAKPLLLQALSDAGLLIDDFQSWTCRAEGNEISLAGKLSSSGLRRLLSVVDSPVGNDVVATKSSGASPEEAVTPEAEKSRDYFRAVLAMYDDLKGDLANVKRANSAGAFCDRYAIRIERLPILGVDEELLHYSAYVSSLLHQVALSTKLTGIQVGLQQSNAGWANGNSYDYYGNAYGNAFGAMAARAQIYAQGKAVSASDLQQVRSEIIAATTRIRRRMTLKYKVEF